MNEYIGKICPFCKTAFSEGDDIVVCSACDMPHHKECWIENQGCTTFGCLGTIQNAGGVANTVTTSQIIYDDASSQIGSNIFCARCGASNAADSSFCVKCGQQLATADPTYTPVTYPSPAPTPATPHPEPQPVYPQSYQQSYADTSSPSQTVSNGGYASFSTVDPDVLGLIGTNAEYYTPRFRDMKANNKTASWHWPAFLVAPYWFMYRKMYGYGLAMMAATLLVNLINAPILSFLWMGVYVVIGIFANNLYMRRLEELAQQAKTMSEFSKSQFMAQRGGINALATILSVFGFVFISLLLTA